MTASSSEEPAQPLQSDRLEPGRSRLRILTQVSRRGFDQCFRHSVREIPHADRRNTQSAGARHHSTIGGCRCRPRVIRRARADRDGSGRNRAFAACRINGCSEGIARDAIRSDPDRATALPGRFLLDTSCCRRDLCRTFQERPIDTPAHGLRPSFGQPCPTQMRCCHGLVNRQQCFVN